MSIALLLKKAKLKQREEETIMIVGLLPHSVTFVAALISNKVFVTLELCYLVLWTGWFFRIPAQSIRPLSVCLAKKDLTLSGTYTFNSLEAEGPPCVDDYGWQDLYMKCLQCTEPSPFSLNSQQTNGILHCQLHTNDQICHYLQQLSGILIMGALCDGETLSQFSQLMPSGASHVIIDIKASPASEQSSGELTLAPFSVGCLQ